MFDSYHVFYDATFVVIELIGVTTPRVTHILCENHLANT